MHYVTTLLSLAVPHFASKKYADSESRVVLCRAIVQVETRCVIDATVTTAKDKLALLMQIGGGVLISWVRLWCFCGVRGMRSRMI